MKAEYRYRLEQSLANWVVVEEKHYFLLIPYWKEMARFFLDMFGEDGIKKAKELINKLTK